MRAASIKSMQARNPEASMKSLLESPPCEVAKNCKYREFHADPMRHRMRYSVPKSGASANSAAFAFTN